MPAAIRILHAIHDYLPRHQAGSEIYLAQLCAAQRRAGASPTVVAAEFDPGRDHGALTWRSHEGIPVVELVNNWRFETFGGTYADPGLSATLSQLLDIVQPHVVHVHNLLNLSFDLPAAADARGIAVAATLHDYTLVCPSGGQRIHQAEAHVCRDIDVDRCARCFPDSPFHSQWRFGQLARRTPNLLASLAGTLRRRAPATMAMAGQALSRAGGVPATTPAAIRQRLESARAAFIHFDVAVAPSASLARGYEQLGFPSERLLVSDYGFDPLPRRPSRTSFDGPLRIGFVGTLVWHKGADVLIDAVRQLPQDRIDVRIYGDPAISPVYAAALRAAAAKAPITFEGAFDRASAAACYADLDVLVVPSRWLENSPLVIHEAFMTGVPVIGSAIGGIEDLLGDGRGVLVPPGDPAALAAALQAVLDEPAHLERLAAARIPVKSIEDDAREWEARYAAVMRGAALTAASS